MNLAEAERILHERLRFGDARQIEAKLFVELLTRAVNEVMRCRRCRGTGFHRGRHCAQCVTHFPPEIVAALGIPRGKTGPSDRSPMLHPQTPVRSLSVDWRRRRRSEWGNQRTKKILPDLSLR